MIPYIIYIHTHSKKIKISLRFSYTGIRVRSTFLINFKSLGTEDAVYDVQSTSKEVNGVND